MKSQHLNILVDLLQMYECCYNCWFIHTRTHWKTALDFMEKDKISIPVKLVLRLQSERLGNIDGSSCSTK